MVICTKTDSFPNISGFSEVKDDLALRKTAVVERRKIYGADCDTTAEITSHQHHFLAE